MNRIPLVALLVCTITSGCGLPPPGPDPFGHPTPRPSPAAPPALLPTPAPGPVATSAPTAAETRQQNPDYVVSLLSYNGHDSRIVERSTFARTGNTYRSDDAISMDTGAGIRNRIWISIPATEDIGPRARMRVFAGCRGFGSDGNYFAEVVVTQLQNERRVMHRIYSADLSSIERPFRLCAPNHVALYVELTPPGDSPVPLAFNLTVRFVLVGPRSDDPERTQEEQAL